MVTIPNLVSVVRLLLVPLFLYLLFGRDNAAAAGWLLGVIASTDWVDGYLARRLNQVSEVGKFLDPLADRLAVMVALVAGLVADVLPTWFAIAVLAREVGVGIGSLVIGLKAGTQIAVRYLGKAATFAIYASVAWFYIGEGTPFDPLVWAAWVVGVPGLVMYYVVAVQYLGDARRVVAAAEPTGSDVEQ